MLTNLVKKVTTWGKLHSYPGPYVVLPKIIKLDQIGMITTMFMQHNLGVYLPKWDSTPLDGKSFMDELDSKNLSRWWDSAFFDTSKRQTAKLVVLNSKYYLGAQSNWGSSRSIGAASNSLRNYLEGKISRKRVELWLSCWGLRKQRIISEAFKNQLTQPKIILAYHGIK